MILSLPVPALAQFTNAAGNPHYIITFRRDVEPGNMTREHALSPRNVYRHAFKGFSAHLNAREVQKLKRDPRVLAVELDTEITSTAQTNGTGIIRMGLINFPMARINGVDERINVNVAVLDSGVQTNHPDLNVVAWIDFANTGLNGDDGTGHGTHVAGIVGALDNDIGVVGVAPGARIWSIQVLGLSGGTWSFILAGMDYIAQHASEIAVANASLTGPTNINPVEAIRQSVLGIVNLGVVFVAAAGNFGMDLTGVDQIYDTADDRLPDALREAMAVSAMDPVDDVLWYASNYSTISRSNNYVFSSGNTIDVTAPGANILSTDLNGGYSVRSGTSMAAPHAAGVVALYIAANGRATNAEGVWKIRQAIVDSAQPVSEWHELYVSDWDGYKEGLARPSESWVPTPRVISQSLSSPPYLQTFTTVPGYRYAVQYSDSLATTNWTGLTNVLGTGAAESFQDPTVTDLLSQRFYRLIRSPAP